MVETVLCMNPDFPTAALQQDYHLNFTGGDVELFFLSLDDVCMWDLNSGMF